MRGVAAAPEGLAGPEWVELVDPSADAELTQALKAWREELAQADDGLGASPAPVSRLAALRAELRQRGLDGFIVPRADEHQGEYVPPAPQRLAWLTGFTGSAGLAIVLADRAAMFVDGRYTLQVRAQVDTDAFEIRHLIPRSRPTTGSPRTCRRAASSATIPGCTTVDGSSGFAGACQRAGGELRAGRCQSGRRGVARPAAGAARRRSLPHPDEFAGESAAAKRARIAGTVKAEGRRRGGDHRARIRSPGCSTSAAATCRARRFRWASRCCTATAASTCSSTAARCRDRTLGLSATR